MQVCLTILDLKSKKEAPKMNMFKETCSLRHVQSTGDLDEEVTKQVIHTHIHTTVTAGHTNLPEKR